MSVNLRNEKEHHDGNNSFLLPKAYACEGKRNKKIALASLAAVNSNAILPQTSSGGRKPLGFWQREKTRGQLWACPRARSLGRTQHCIFGTLLLVQQLLKRQKQACVSMKRGFLIKKKEILPAQKVSDCDCWLCGCWHWRRTGKRRGGALLFP